LPDDTIAVLLRKLPQTAGDFVNTLAAGGVSLREQGAWLLGDVRPSFFDRAHYMNRSVLRKWVKAMLARTPSWIRRMSDLYAHAGDAASNGLTSWYGNVVWPVLDVPNQPQMSTRWALMALGSCSDAEWAALEGGSTVSVLGPLDRLQRIEQWSWTGPTILERLNGSTGIDAELLGSFTFPAGPPDTGTIRLENSIERMVGVTINGKVVWFTMYDLANRVQEAELPRPTTEDGIIRAMKGSYKLGTRVGGEILVTLNPRLCLRCQQPNGDVEVVSEGATIDTWPAGFIKDFKAGIAEILALRSTSGSPPPP
jgi:hypothetical protein